LAQIVIKSILPQDTRILELYGAVGLVWLGLHFALGVVIAPDLLAIHPAPFWAAILIAGGTMQFSTVVFYPNADVLRVIVSWFIGGLWVWVGLATGDTWVRPGDIAAFVLGLANLYASIINANLIRHKWS
jgi:hypothetical protein